MALLCPCLRCSACVCQVCFLAPPLPKVSTDGRLHNTVMLNWPTADQWAPADSAILNVNFLVGVMETELMPIFMWRSDFARVREHIVHMSTARRTPFSTVDDAFDEQFAAWHRHAPAALASSVACMPRDPLLLAQ